MSEPRKFYVVQFAWISHPRGWMDLGDDDYPDLLSALEQRDKEQAADHRRTYRIIERTERVIEEPKPPLPAKSA